MSFKRTFNEDQQALGKFVEGLSVNVVQYIRTKIGIVEEETVDDSWKRKPWRGKDCLDEIIDVIMSIQGMKVLVCPTCKVDLDPHEPSPDPIIEGKVIIDNTPRVRIPNFCKCPTCELSYFIYEIIKQKSFRQKLKSENELDYLFFANAGTMIKISVCGIHEEFRFVKS